MKNLSRERTANMTITGAELLLELLERNGVERIFCSPGTEWAAIWEALVKREAEGKKKLEYVNCRHEMLAVSTAAGYAEGTGKLPGVLLHSGIGTLHGSMALRTAYFAKVPMIVLSGETYEHAGDDEIRPQGWVWLSLLSDVGGPSSLVKGYVKWSNSISSKDSLIDLVSRGCAIARATPQGPVFLSVPVETLIRAYPECRMPEPYRDDTKHGPAEGLIEEAAERLVNGKKPMIITEYGGRQPGAVARLVELSEMLSIPVFEAANPIYGNFPRHHHLYMGFESSGALRDADTVLVVGGSAPWYPPLACDADVLVTLLDDDPLHQNLPHWGYPIDLTLSGNIEKGLASLIAAVGRRMKTKKRALADRLKNWQTKHKELMASWEKQAHADKKKRPISPNWLLHEWRRLMPEDTMIIDETITVTRAVSQYTAEPGRYIRAGYGGLGVGMGQAIGIKMAYPDRPVLLLVGDGAFFYNPVLAGLGLCQEYNLPIIIAIMNNGGYLGMKRTHERLYPKGYAARSNTYLGFDIAPAPDYTALAATFGFKGKRLENPEDIEGMLMWAFDEVKEGRCALLDVVI